VKVRYARGRDSFAYFRAEHNEGGHTFDSKPLVRDVTMQFSDFVDAADQARKQREAGKGPLKADHLYCQELLTGHPELEREFATWDWVWALDHCEKLGWGEPDLNVLFMSTANASIPAHYEERHNFLAQARGRQIVVLFPPDDYTNMYPFPVTHPCDRVSMVDVVNPDLRLFPNFANASGQVAVLEAGDVLYIPYGWWYYTRTETHLAASVTFWSVARDLEEDAAENAKKAAAKETVEMGPNDWVRVRRNIEKMLAEDAGPPLLRKEVSRLLAAIERKDIYDQRILVLKKLLKVVGVPDEDQLQFLVDMFSRRFLDDQEYQAFA